MKESDFLKVSNNEKINLVISILNSVFLGSENGIDDEKMLAVIGSLEAQEKALADKITIKS